ncbi:MAG: GNAT family N-acetyltransferase [Armatimonadetes bacterium]|nr:GNAT family N-acetyltransferase [Armatimonadota bacterium]
MPDVLCREMREDEAAAACAFTESIFGPLPLDYWLKEPRYTAAVSYLDGELAGVIPLSLRRFQLAPGVVAETAWENAVGTRADLRGQGVGSRMIAAARDFLADRCDLLCVYRGAERSDGYRFYADRTGHIDLAYVPFYRLASPSGSRPSGFDSLAHGEVPARGAELAKLFNSQWAEWGGFVAREPGYYDWAIDHIIYGRIPTERRLHLLTEAGQTTGFAITGVRQGARADGTCYVLDFAAAEGDPRRAGLLLQGVVSVAAEAGCPLVWPHAQRGALATLLEAAGFERGQRRMMLMGLPLRPSRLFGLLAAARGGCEVTLDVWTSTTDFRLWDAGPTAPRCTLEMKDRELALLLTSRLDGRQALEEERITLAGPAAAARVEPVLARLLRCTPWHHPYLEYI